VCPCYPTPLDVTLDHFMPSCIGIGHTPISEYAQMDDEAYASIGRSVHDRFALMHHGDGVARCKKKTVYSGKSLPESFRPVEVEEHSILAVLAPSAHLLERARRIDHLNRIYLSDLSDDSTADTTG
jgi:hypothetical protein